MDEISIGGVYVYQVLGIIIGVIVFVVLFVTLYDRRSMNHNQIQNSPLPLQNDGQTQKSQCNISSPVNDQQHSKYDNAPRIPPVIQSPLQQDSVVLVETSVSSRLGFERRSHSPQPHPHWIPKPFSIITFTCEELALATDNFSDANLLGQGGFGYVHKGLLPNGKEIAVKQLKTGHDRGHREFQAEVEIISRVHHRHLVSLVGYCISEEKRMLVYKFIPNKTLEFHLHGQGRPPMNWATRLTIALGAAKGLAYLHEDCDPKIIHRDVKAANILLNNDFEAKVADFGLAKFFPDTDTHVSTVVAGTLGYLDPEYALSGKLTDKSDIFSFGVVLLELITGCRPRQANCNIVEWARPLLRQALSKDEGLSFLRDGSNGCLCFCMCS